MTAADHNRRIKGVEDAIERATDQEEYNHLVALRDEMDGLTDPAYRELYEESLHQQEVMAAVTEYGAYHLEPV